MNHNTRNTYHCKCASVSGQVHILEVVSYVLPKYIFCDDLSKVFKLIHGVTHDYIEVMSSHGTVLERIDKP